ncbi:YhfC family glutamic-type intramembrane protease [Peptoniphilus senegalensis]|uniref:YhfC family glutamic-type intramembrane protease n=1 Tax=Peptoniphilus senegalensis TaxID=1465757 RepID=UPI00031E1993|nr:YhfC family glutamic-type intramembrane protease [Peptoniphilus senegalensis]
MKKFLKLFLLGMICFVLSQLCLRLPLLKLLNNNLWIYSFQSLYPLIYGFLLTLSAGLFEEGGRFIFRDKILKENNSKSDAIIFGLGHGLIEVIFVIILSFNNLNLLTSSDIFLGLYERLLAVIFHIGMTVLIWLGFNRMKKYRYLILAIFLHGFFDYFIILKNIFEFSNLILYGSWTLLCVIILIFIFKINLGGNRNEKI